MQSRYIIKATESTPKIVMDYDLGQISMQGICVPENASDFFDPVIAWLEEYCSYPQKKTQIAFELDYFNTSSLISITDFFKIVSKIQQNPEYELDIVWFYYEDDVKTIEGIQRIAEFYNLKVDFVMAEE